MTDKRTDAWDITHPTEPLALRLSEGLGPAARLVMNLRTPPMSDTQAPRIDRMRMAADEIERLRDALQRLLEALPSNHLFDEPPPRLSDLANGLANAKAAALQALGAGGVAGPNV